MAIMHGSPACHSTAPSPSQPLAVMPTGRTATSRRQGDPGAGAALRHRRQLTTSGTVISNARTPAASISTLVTQERQGASACGPVTSTYEEPGRAGLALDLDRQAAGLAAEKPGRPRREGALVGDQPVDRVASRVPG